MPFTWSLALRYKLSNRFGLESGLSYSRLTSDFKMGADGNVIREQQTIHYLGIPIKGIYNLSGIVDQLIFTRLMPFKGFSRISGGASMVASA